MIKNRTHLKSFPESNRMISYQRCEVFEEKRSILLPNSRATSDVSSTLALELGYKKLQHANIKTG